MGQDFSDNTKRLNNTNESYKNPKDNDKTLRILKSCLFPLILILLCLLSYQHALNGTFVFDDTVAIVKNKDVTQQPANYTAIFQHDFWGASLSSKDSHKSYRPFTTLMFHFEYAQLEWRAPHMKLVNLMLHTLNTLLVWSLLRSIRLELLQKKRQISSIAAALFACHPIHTEAVCGVVGRADLVVAMFYLLALQQSLRPSLKSDIQIVILTALGMLFKETAITILLACSFLDFMQHKAAINRLYSWRNLCYAFITFMLIIIRLWIQNFESPGFKPMDNPVGFSDDALTRILSQQYLYVLNIWIMLCPQWLSYDWALGCIELIRDMWDLRIQAVLAMYSFLIVMLMHFKQNLNIILAFGLTVIPFLPASGIINVGFVIAERVLYIPSIGFCLLIANVFVFLHDTVDGKLIQKVLKCMLMLLFVFYLLRTRERATEWLTEEQLFTSALQVCPKNAKVSLQKS